MSSVEKTLNSFWSEWDVFFRAINDFSLKHEGSEFFKEAIIALFGQTTLLLDGE